MSKQNYANPDIHDPFRKSSLSSNNATVGNPTSSLCQSGVRTHCVYKGKSQLQIGKTNLHINVHSNKKTDLHRNQSINLGEVTYLCHMTASDPQTDQY